MVWGWSVRSLWFVCYICFFYVTKNDKSTLSWLAQFGELNTKSNPLLDQNKAHISLKQAEL